MGCGTSKSSVCKNCQKPVARSYSMQVHHPPQREGDTYHVVALTSSTLGSLRLDSMSPINQLKKKEDSFVKDDDLNGVIEAKKWSEMIEEKIPKVLPRTPVSTPLGDPETINVWEMMEGLEETSPIRPSRHHQRSFSFHVNRDSFSCDSPISKSKENGDDRVGLDPNEDVDATISKFDETEHGKEQSLAGSDKLIEVIDTKQVNDDVVDCKLTSFKPKRKDKVVLYFTSLRGVRKTYEDCCHVRVILKGIGVRIDERDISMHSGFKDELKDLLGEGYFSKGLGLPRVFLRNQYIGGAEEIRRYHEEGKLEKVLEGCERDDIGGGACEACGDLRFVPCETCSGSCKIYYEGDYNEEYDNEEEFDDSDFGFQRCPDCNENGLVRCPICCD